MAFLGRIPGTRRYSDLARHETNEPIPDVLAFRVEAAIVYFNVEHIADTVLARFEAMTQKPKLVICDLSTSANVDMAGAQLFLSLESELKKRGATFRVVEARSTVRDMLRLEGVEDRVRPDRSLYYAGGSDRRLSGKKYPPGRNGNAADNTGNAVIGIGHRASALPM